MRSFQPDMELQATNVTAARPVARRIDRLPGRWRAGTAALPVTSGFAMAAIAIMLLGGWALSAAETESGTNKPSDAKQPTAAPSPTTAPSPPAAKTRTYENRLRRLENPPPLLGDHPEFVEPVREKVRFEAPLLVDDADSDLAVRAWRFSYNARGIIEMPNRLRARDTAIIMVHPWGVDDGQGWRTPEPAGAADFCTPEKNHLAARHTREVIDPFLQQWRSHVGVVAYSLPGREDPIRRKLYRSVRGRPSETERREGAAELAAKLNGFRYEGQHVPTTLALSTDTPVIDYFKQFRGLDAGPRFNGEGFWDLPIPVTRDITAEPDDVVIYDAEGYPALRDFLRGQHIRHVLLVGYATDMCFCKTTAGYENLSGDFNVFLVGDATLATFPANSSPRYATNASISFAALEHLVTQVSWVKPL